MNQPELTKLQRQVLQVFKKIDAQETVTSVARHLKLEIVLAKSMLDKLAELKYLRIKHIGTSHLYVMLPAGVNYLRQMVNAPVVQSPLSGSDYSQQHCYAFSLIEEAGSFGLSGKAVSDKMHIGRQEAVQLLEKLKSNGHIKKWANGIYHIPAAGSVLNKTEAQSEPTAEITPPTRIVLANYELKQQVLERLSPLFEDSISSVLTDIRTDLQHIHTLNSGVQQ
ncbi:hypothetical protein [Rheinheimera baltica]|uniref:hypothetical protein n=1 Tax=Rheinheimera baltica TaxID=67576 RepID=UPI000415734F|nr:hypothetical protein [Rheinheimera baltica]